MRRFVGRSSAWMMDSVMCAMMNRIQWKLRDHGCTREEFEAYIEACRPFDAETFYFPVVESKGPDLSQSAAIGWPRIVEWPTPHPSGFVENDTARALFFSSTGDWTRPAVIVLHALMSASDIGYRRMARWFNLQGWNVVFPHLPFHYSRAPHGFRPGSLAITANLPRNAETLRQGVTEIRQIMAALRARGTREFGMLGTSYGGWTAALAAPLEPDFRFVSLIQPIVDIEHVIWESPIAAGLRRVVQNNGIARGTSADHSHLSSPMHVPASTAPMRLIVSGEYDSVSPRAPLLTMRKRWNDTDLVSVPQGHFGYRALAAAREWIAPIL